MNSEGIPFGRYILVERLAVGGMAELYRAVLPGPSGFQKVVAIKKILRDLARHQQFRKMFEHEGRIMAALCHRNLVQVFELGEVDSELFLCLEFVPGVDLAAVLHGNRTAERTLSPPLAAWIARELCYGLDYVHGLTDEAGRSMRIVHRDVNPHNVLLSIHGDVKLGDFGIAKSLVGEVRTVGREVKGKLEYLSPEQANSDTVGPQADLYSVGLILFEMLTSVRYIQGVGQHELLKNAAKPAWRSPQALNPAVPDALAAIVERALRPEPDKRFGSARAMVRALSEYLDETPRTPSSYDVADLVAQVSAKAPRAEDGLCPVFEKTPTQKKPGSDLHALRGAVPDASSMPSKMRKSSVTVSLGSDQPRPVTRVSRRARWLWIGGLVLLVGVGAAIERFRDHTEKWSVSVPHAVPNVDAEQGGAAQTDTHLPGDKPGGKTSDNKQGGLNRAVPPIDLKPEEVLPPRDPGPSRPALPAAMQSGILRLDELQQELARQRLRLAERGVQPVDSPTIERLMALIERQLADEPGQATQNLRELDQEIERLVIDGPFVERKIVRLQIALVRSGQNARYADDTRRILEHAINNRFEQANAIINRILEKLNR